MKEEDLSQAVEKLVTRIMYLSSPLPTSLQRDAWDDCLELGVQLASDEESEDDPKFWERFQAFKKELN